MSEWRNGDARAGERLFERYFRAVARFFANKVAGDPDDLVQETFLACVRGRDRVQRTHDFRAYLFGVAYNVLKSHIRRKYRPDFPADLDSCSAHDLAPGPSTVLHRCEEERLLLDALRQVPLTYQVLVELYYWESMTTEQIGLTLDLPVGTVRGRLRRARARLEQILQRMPGESHLQRSAIDGLDDWARGLRARVL
ncbi:MAG: sigma-70 family RNA polymerase sigma factor [Myxococcota bacterium]